MFAKSHNINIQIKAIHLTQMRLPRVFAASARSTSRDYYHFFSSDISLTETIMSNMKTITT